MLSQTVEYALRAIVYLAKRPDAPSKTSEIAKATKVPSAYLVKVLQSLRKESIVSSLRGIGGGVTLAIPPEELTILQVVQAVDPIRRIETCPLGLAEHGSRLCPLHRKMDNALEHVEQAFGSTTLADIVNDPSASVPLGKHCDFG